MSPRGLGATGRRDLLIAMRQLGRSPARQGETQGMLLRHRPSARIDSPASPAPPTGLRAPRRGWSVLRWLQANRVEFVLVGPVAEAIRGERRRRRAGGDRARAVRPQPRSPSPRAVVRARAAARLDVRERGVGELGHVPVKLTAEKLLRGGRWTLRCGAHDLDIEGCPPGRRRATRSCCTRPVRSSSPPDVCVEVASPEDIEHYAHVRRTGSAPEIRVTASRANAVA